MIGHVKHGIWDLLAGDQLLDDPLETLSTLYHMDDKHSLVVSVLFEDVVFELDISCADSHHQCLIVCFLLDGQLLTTDQINIVLDVDYGEL